MPRLEAGAHHGVAPTPMVSAAVACPNELGYDVPPAFPYCVLTVDRSVGVVEAAELHVSRSDP